jgi:putative (di)nucleoside polyphosphate hydrolase
VKTTTHGLLVMNAAAELLLCHATGTRHWDIPKGIAEAGESNIDAAVREAREECGLEVDRNALLPLGTFAYRPDKDLALHALLVDRIDPAGCRCSSTFVDRFGRERPEMDAFRWTPFDEVASHCAKNMARVLTTDLSLAAVLERLLDRPARTRIEHP